MFRLYLKELKELHVRHYTFAKDRVLVFVASIKASVLKLLGKDKSE
jgi:uncharacterized protein with gpF-like domain|tara:strand:- start:526 stop:663 length:138 start_codon:yes stop_codon:yes gene_type:complete